MWSFTIGNLTKKHNMLILNRKERKMAKQKTISVSPQEYDQLKRTKNLYQQKLGRKVDWGAFLLGLGLGFLAGCLIADGLNERKNKRINRKE